MDEQEVWFIILVLLPIASFFVGIGVAAGLTAWEKFREWKNGIDDI